MNIWYVRDININIHRDLCISDICLFLLYIQAILNVRECKLIAGYLRLIDIYNRSILCWGLVLGMAAMPDIGHEGWLWRLYLSDALAPIYILNTQVWLRNINTHAINRHATIVLTMFSCPYRWITIRKLTWTFLEAGLQWLI